jgi:hypothetical protein
MIQKLEGAGAKVAEWARPRLPALARIGRVAFWVLLAGVIGYQLYTGWSTISQYDWRFRWTNILGLFPLHALSLALTVVVWTFIMRRLAGTGSWWTHLRLYCLSGPARRLPTPVWYMGVRAVAYQELDTPRKATIVASLVEMMVTNMGALLVALASFRSSLLIEELSQVRVELLLLVPLVILMLRPMLLIRLVNVVLRRLNRDEITARIGSGDMLRWVGLFVVVFLNGGLILHVAVNSIYSLPLDRLPAMINAFSVSWLMGWLAQVLLFLPNSAVRQLSLAYLLSFYMPWPVAIACTVLRTVAVLLFELFWAFAFSRLKA